MHYRSNHQIKCTYILSVKPCKDGWPYTPTCVKEGTKKNCEFFFLIRTLPVLIHLRRTQSAKNSSLTVRQWNLLITPLLSTLLILPSSMLCFALEDMGPCLIYQTTKPWKKLWERFMRKGGLPLQFAMDQLVSGPSMQPCFSKSCWLNVVTTGTLRQQQRSPLLVTLASIWSAPASLSELILIGWIPPRIWKTGVIPDKWKGIIIFPFFHFWSLGPAQICIKKIQFSSSKILYTAGQLVFGKISFAKTLSEWYEIYQSINQFYYYSKHLKLSFSSMFGG